MRRLHVHTTKASRVVIRDRSIAGWVTQGCVVLVFAITHIQPLAAQIPEPTYPRDELQIRDTSNPGRTSVSSADAYIRRVFSEEDSSQFEDAAAAYLQMLDQRNLSPAEQEIVNLHLAAALLVIPRGATIPRAFNGPEIEEGPTVVRWWKGQDPFPSTPRNERLEEHLSRWALALELFASENERGFDDRGEVYIRLGNPGKRISVRLNESMRAFDFNAPFPAPKLPESEMWVYRHVHDEAYYFFALESQKDGFQLARPSDSIPQPLRNGLNYRTPRGRDKTDMLLLVMEELYAQLALAHPNFGPTYDEIVRFRGLPGSSSNRPDLFVRSTLTAASVLETESSERRDALVPTAFTETRGLTEPLEIETRWARFLEPSGTTRTEIYWSVDTSDLRPSRRHERQLTEMGYAPSEQYLLQVAVRQHAEDYAQRTLETRHYLLDPTSGNAAHAQLFTVRGDTGIYNLAAQWSQHWMRTSTDGRISEGPMLKVATVWLSDVDALHGAGEQLEMSDLKAVHSEHPDVPYPSSKMARNAAPALYFEIYNLKFDSEDKTRYTIEYEIAAASKPSIRTDDRIRVRSNASGAERTAREYVGVALDEWRGSGAVEITVRVTDDVTSEQVSRSIRFHVEP